jgi:hypothetical protein
MEVPNPRSFAIIGEENKIGERYQSLSIIFSTLVLTRNRSRRSQRAKLSMHHADNR